MIAPKPARIFISYAVKDGSDAAGELRQRLEAEGFAIWQDVVALEGGRDWWSQIEDAIRAPSVEHLVLVVSPEALSRPVVRREIRLGKTLGKQVTPVQSGPELNLGNLPRWLGHVLDPCKPEHWAQLVKAVSGPSQQARMPMMAPEPPTDFVARPNEFDTLKKQLLDSKGDAAVGITAALRGAGGYGKTTLAKALAHDADIQEAYFDGVLWVELGEQGIARVVKLISDLVTLITGKPPGIATREAAATALAEALGDRRFLLIIDDVWQRAALDPFLKGGTSTTRLVTTRFDRELPEATVRQPVDAMARNEALALLSWGLPPSDVKTRTSDLQALSAKLGEWAQLLKLVNGFLRDRVVKHKQVLAAAIQDVTLRLDARGLAAFDDQRAKDYDTRHRSVAAVVNTTLELLDKDQRARFGELGIFPEDADIPIEIVARLWAETGRLDEIATEDLLRELYDLSLLLSLDFESRTFRFHDTTRHYLQGQAGKDGLVAQHKRLLRAIDDMGGAEENDARSNRYFYEYLPDHLAGAGDRATLDALMLDPGWLQQKLQATNNPLGLVADYDRHGVDQMQNLIGQTLRLTAGICARDQMQLLPQLLGRLIGSTALSAPAFLDQARRLVRSPALMMQRLSLTPPGDEVARLEGHTARINAVALLPDGRLASGSWDKTIRLWDLKTTAEIARLEGHTDAITNLVVLADGRLASSSDDRTIRLWDLANGNEVGRIDDFRGIGALAALPDGRLAIAGTPNAIALSAIARFEETRQLKDLLAGSSNAIWLWDVASFVETGRLEGHKGPVLALTLLPDGRLASGSQDKSIRLWDVITGIEAGRLDGHTGQVTTLAPLLDGGLASASDDRTIRLWDVSTACETMRISAPEGVRTLTTAPNGRIVSNSNLDHSILLWDLQTGAETKRLNGHLGTVNTLAVTADGRLVSGSEDETIRLWDLANLADEVRLDVGWVTALELLPDGRVASGSSDWTIKLWDPGSRSAANSCIGAETARLEGHTDRVTSLTALPDGRLASGSKDKTIRIWDVSTGMEIGRLNGHDAAVWALTVLPDGRLASGSQDKSIRLWDLSSCSEIARFNIDIDYYGKLLALQDGRLATFSKSEIHLWDVATGAEIGRLDGHTQIIEALALLPDGRVASGAADNTIRLWDLTTRAESMLLEGHLGRVSAVAPLGGDRLASGSWDHTVRLWDLKSGKEICRLELDAIISCLTAFPDSRSKCWRLVVADKSYRMHWIEIVD